jgi:toxin ParE1/3/4
VRTVRYHPDARAEFLNQVEYYIAIGTRLADRYNTAVHVAEQQAAATPEAWPKYKHRTRRVVDRTFKFSLVYLYREREIYVVAVAPMRRKPGYWRARLSDA